MKRGQYRLLLSILFCLIISGCKSDKSKNPNIPDNAINTDVINNPASASGNTKDNVPVIQFVNESHDFGKILEGEKVSFAFQFKNVGKGDLVIRHAQGSCGCTVPEFPKDPVPPGAEGVINVTFNSEGKEGIQNKTVTIISNTMPNTKEIRILAEVEKAKK